MSNFTNVIGEVKGPEIAELLKNFKEVDNTKTIITLHSSNKELNEKIVLYNKLIKED